MIIIAIAKLSRQFHIFSLQKYLSPDRFRKRLCLKRFSPQSFSSGLKQTCLRNYSKKYTVFHIVIHFLIRKTVQLFGTVAMKCYPILRSSNREIDFLFNFRQYGIFEVITPRRRRNWNIFWREIWNDSQLFSNSISPTLYDHVICYFLSIQKYGTL